MAISQQMYAATLSLIPKIYWAVKKFTEWQKS